MPNVSKIETVRALRASLTSADGVVVLEHFGVTGPDMADLRQQLNRRGWRLVVLKNTLARRAAYQTPAAGLMPLFSGPTALLVAPEDGRGALKAVVDRVRALKPDLTAEAWARYLADPEAARSRWLVEARARGSQNWPARPRPGSLLRVRGALLDGQILSAEEALVEADLSPQEVYVCLLHTIQAPVRQIYAVLQAGPVTLARLLEAHRAQTGEGGADVN